MEIRIYRCELTAYLFDPKNLTDDDVDEIMELFKLPNDVEEYEYCEENEELIFYLNRLP